MDVSFSCVCPVIDPEFRQNIVKVALKEQIRFLSLGQHRLNYKSVCLLVNERAIIPNVIVKYEIYANRLA